MRFMSKKVLGEGLNFNRFQRVPEGFMGMGSVEEVLGKGRDII